MTRTMAFMWEAIGRLCDGAFRHLSDGFRQGYWAGRVAAIESIEQ